MDEIEEQNEILFEIQEESYAASVDLLPAITQQRYKKEYENFENWRNSKNVKVVNEDVLLAYAKGKSEVYSPNSLWTKISMLKHALRVYDNIDISRFGKLFLFLRRKSDGYTPKKSKILSEEDVMKFLLEANDYTWLLEKVVLMCGIFGACRREELVKLSVDDFESTSTKVLVTLRMTKNKKNRVFVIPKEGLPFDAYGLYQKYVDLRPSNLENRRFFIGYRNGKCVKQVVGIHTIGGVPKKIAAFLKLENPQLYTGHSFRRFSATMLVENGGDLLSVKELRGWDSSAVAESYIENSVSKRMKLTRQLFHSNEASPTTSSTTAAINGDLGEDELDIKPDPIPLKPFEGNEEIKSESAEEAFLHNQSDLGEDELELKPDPIPVKPFGDDLLRVCRTCFRIMKIEEAVPLILSTTHGLFEETELCIRLKIILQVDLFAVENPCLCQKCEAFINAVDTFRSTCRANEEVLRDFDWDCKTLNLLYVVDQDELKDAYDLTKRLKSEETEENVTSPIQSPDLAETWLEEDKRGNGLSDLEDHWYSTDTKVDPKDHDYTSNNQEASGSSSIPNDDDLFSPNFDRYFEKVQDRISVRLKIKCKRYHNKYAGEGPFLCELCGKFQSSRAVFTKHTKLHKSSHSFHCTQCNNISYEWDCYMKHCRSVHGSSPRTLKCPRCSKMYLHKKNFANHLRIHELDDSKQVCSICRDVFDDKSLFDEHKRLHKPNKIQYKLCGRSNSRGSLKRHIQTKHSNRNTSSVARVYFQCTLCSRSYKRIGCLELHQKYCNGNK